MSPTPRRINTYWLLLLVSSLIVGTAMLVLLQREQGRLAAQNASALESRRAAVSARAQLIVENIELLVGDVQNGLLDTLASGSESTTDVLLDDWRRNNPLVKTAFRATAGGQLLYPTANAQDESARGFVRRFGPTLRSNPPWTPAAPGKAAVADSQSQSKIVSPTDAAARQAVTSNVIQVQNARRDLQDLFKSRSRTSEPTGAAAAASEYETRKPSSPVVAGTLSRSPPREKATVAVAPGNERRGWLALPVTGRLHLLTWIQPTRGGEVLGAEIDAGTLMDKLAGAMPAEVNPAEGYVFRDPTGRVIHQVGSVPVGAPPSSVVPVDATLLPGWTVAGFLDVDSSHGPFGPALFWTAVLLLAVFIAAILAGGSLLRAQARRSDAEAAQKTSFVANVSHEFKTPLTTIRLYAELLEQNRVRNAEQGAEYLRTIGRESQRLTRLVNNVLDFSRLEQGRKKFRCEPIDLVAELNTLLDCHGPRLTEAGLRLDRRLPDGRVDVVTDRDALAQVMLNLLDNACKYAAQAGTVEVTLATMPSDRVELRVADRGPGVPADQRELIFEKFHRVDDALTAEKTGAGLGLSIARQLARGLGGDLRCVARAGGGAEFVLDLPSPPTKSLS